MFFETLKTDALLNNFQDVESQPFTVIRDGSPLEILGKDIVVGDIITVEHDHKVPADIRILDCTADLIVDNSAISSAPDAENSPRHWRSEMDHPLLTENLMFRGTAIKEGSLKYGVVIKVGDDTQAGRMLKLASVDDYDSKFKSALQQEIDRTTYLFLWFAFGLAFTSMIILFLTGTNYEAVVIGAGILVSSVPLGLPIVIAMTQRVALDKLKVSGVITVSDASEQGALRGASPRQRSRGARHRSRRRPPNRCHSPAGASETSARPADERPPDSSGVREVIGEKKTGGWRRASKRALRWVVGGPLIALLLAI